MISSRCKPGYDAGYYRHRAPCLLALVLVIYAMSFHPCPAADQPARPTLDDYLKKLRYEPVATEKVTPRGGGGSAEIGLRNRLFVRGELGNGRKPLLLVDTGWGVTTLNLSTARGLKTPAEAGVVLEDSVLGQVTNSSVVIMDKLQLGRAAFFNQPARSEKIEMDYLRVSFDGVLGMDFLSRNYCLIDCTAGRLYVRASEPTADEKSALKESLRRSGYVEVSARFWGALLVDVQINEQPVTLLVDTGSDFTMLDSAEAKRLNLPLAKEDHAAIGSMMANEYSGQIVGVGKIGAHEFKVATVKALKMGKRTCSEVHVGTADLSHWHIAKPGRFGANVRGFLGAELLRNNGALIDFEGWTIWLAPQN